MIAQERSSAQSSTQYSCFFSPPRKLIVNRVFWELAMILPVVFMVLAAPPAEPFRQTWRTEKPPSPLPVNSVVGAWQSRWPLLGVRAISYHLPL
jgi:hypothetical protein